MAESRRRARPKSQEGFFRRLFPRYENTSVDLTFLVMVILLLVFGLVMMFSASYAQGYYREGNSYHYIVRQLLWAVVGLGAMFVFSRMDYHVWRKLAWPLFPVVTAMLILCYFMPPVNAAHHHQQNGGGKVGFLYDEAGINAQHHRKGENTVAEPPQLFFIGNKQVRKQQYQ